MLLKSKSKLKTKHKKKSFVRIVEAIIKDSKGNILLLKRSGVNSIYVGKWQLPGGKAWKGESAKSAIKREVLEETNCKCSKVELLKSVVFTEKFNGTVSTVELNIFSCAVKGCIVLSKDHTKYRFARSSKIMHNFLAPISKKALFD